VGRYEAAPLAYIDPHLRARLGSKSLLDHLPYVPSERNQAYCGNCWAWAGTGCLEIALYVQEGVSDRLSVQHINSCESSVIGVTCCDGGWLSDFADFYAATGRVLPWSNTGAHWQDADASCDTTCVSVTTSPDDAISSISEETIATTGVGQATAIANIKNILDQNRAVWFAFFLAKGSDWTAFSSFWNGQAESVTWDPDTACGHAADSGYGGHAVLCVGYNDDDPGNRYWIMVNSWGTTSLRPNGIFRVKMDVNYDCTHTYYGYIFDSYYWQTLDVTFGDLSAPATTPSCVSFQPSSSTAPAGFYRDSTGAFGPHGGPSHWVMRRFGWVP
jgi:hypothetical protein